MDFAKISEYAGRVSVAALLIAAFFLGQQGYWVYGTQYKEMSSERDTWKAMALKGTNLAAELPRGIAAAPVAKLSPLPENATAEQVQTRLETIQSVSGYKTEPTDKPLP